MGLIAVGEALAKVLEGVEPLPPQAIALAQCCGRVLAADLAARRSQPPAAVSAMDGYALRAADVARAPVELAVIGEVAAGRPFAARIGAGQAARIFTGGVLPPGADAVIIQEKAERRGARVLLKAPVSPGANVRAQALDFSAGQIVLPRGRRLSDRDVALAASMNHAEVAVVRRPKVALLGTGDELVAPGGEPDASQIVYCNGFALMALCQKEGAEARDFGCVADRIEAIQQAIGRMRSWGADIIVTMGGASVGDYDLVGQALHAEGLLLSFWKVALRPGRPMMHGRLGNIHVLGLPGNPVSSYVCARLFLVPLIWALCGERERSPSTEPARLGCALGENDERADYLRATLARASDGSLVATPFAVQDSSMLVPLAQADCLIIREPFAAAAPAGTRCSIIKLAL